MEHRAGPGRLGHSTAHRIINRKTLPADRHQLEAFLDALEVHQPALRNRWLQAWDRIADGPTRNAGGHHEEVYEGWRDHLKYVITPAELAFAVRQRHGTGGSPSMRELALRSGGTLQPAQAREVLRQTDALPHRDSFLAFLKALGVGPTELPLWEEARNRVVHAASDHAA